MRTLQTAMRTSMETHGYAENSIETYLSRVGVFAKYFGRSPLLISTDEIETFFHFLRKERRSESTIYNYYVALRYLYRINDSADRMPALKFRRVRSQVPRILSQATVINMIQRCDSLKYRALFSLVYSSGLRLAELLNLTVDDLDFDRKQVFIRKSKNRKSRYSILGDRAIQLLKIYLNVYKPNSYVFYNMQDVSMRISRDAIGRQFRKLLEKCEVRAKSVTFHTLRHCFATHLLENGTSIFHIMHLLGHSSIQTTMIYLHTQPTYELNITSPIDLLEPMSTGEAGPQRELFERTA